MFVVCRGNQAVVYLSYMVFFQTRAGAFRAGSASSSSKGSKSSTPPDTILDNVETQTVGLEVMDDLADRFRATNCAIDLAEVESQDADFVF